MRAKLKARLADAWFLKLLCVNAVASTLDYGLMLTLVVGMGLPTPVGTASGIALGATFSFFGNRTLTFRQTERDRLWGQAARYVLAMGVMMMLHTAAVWAMRDAFGVPLVPAKMTADVVLFGLLQSLILRHFVFAPATPTAATPEAAALAAQP
jgi:putative flippase GtrA